LSNYTESNTKQHLSRNWQTHYFIWKENSMVQS